MKQNCYVVKDLLGNYIEGLVSEETAADIKEHLSECAGCSQVYANMTAKTSADQIQRIQTPEYSAENVGQVTYLKKYNKAWKILKTVAVIAIAAAVFFAGAFGLLATMWVCGNERDITQDVSQYELYLGQNGKYKSNYLGYNDIFPDKLPASAKVEEFYCEYYNPWDGNYLSYLVYTCPDADYEKECARLDGIKSSDSYNVYGATGFRAPYKLRAVYSDDYRGIIYALSNDAENKLVYVGLEFCNFFTDIDYEDIIEKQYLPIGFDANDGNQTRQDFDSGKLRIGEQQDPS